MDILVGSSTCCESYVILTNAVQKKKDIKLFYLKYGTISVFEVVKQVLGNVLVEGK
jgi:hypothetical protein